MLISTGSGRKCLVCGKSLIKINGTLKCSDTDCKVAMGVARYINFTSSEQYEQDKIDSYIKNR